MNKRRRSTIEKMILSKTEKIQKIDSEIVELQKEAMLLSDKKQQFVEKEEEILICGRPKKYETKLTGRIFWKEGFSDEDTGEVIMIERSQVVRVNGEWI